jgi:dTDP-4-dehydrorhamnose reductase
MRVMVLGATGMLGHKLVQVLAEDFELVATCRSYIAQPPFPRGVQLIDGINAREAISLDACILAVKPDVVLNAVGVVKQAIRNVDRAEVIEINALLPNRLATTCAKVGARLIQFGTDCVFSGEHGSERGASGYRETDPADARDLYGLSKLLGEPDGQSCLTLRTSIVGPELRGRQGLLDWFLAQGDTTIRGFTQALFTGLPTVVLAELVGTILRQKPDLEGVWHVSADPISKYDLLCLFKSAWEAPTRILPEADFFCDRRLDGSRFGKEVGWRAAPWPELVSRMHSDAVGDRYVRLLDKNDAANAKD